VAGVSFLFFSFRRLPFRNLFPLNFHDPELSRSHFAKRSALSRVSPPSKTRRFIRRMFFMKVEQASFSLSLSLNAVAGEATRLRQCGLLIPRYFVLHHDSRHARVIRTRDANISRRHLISPAIVKLTFTNVSVNITQAPLFLFAESTVRLEPVRATVTASYPFCFHFRLRCRADKYCAVCIKR